MDSRYTAESMLAVRTQYEKERIELAFDDVLFRLYGEAAHDLLEERHYRRPEETALLKVKRLSFNAMALMPIPVFIKSVPELTEAWMEGVAERLASDQFEEEMDSQDAFLKEQREMASAFQRCVL